MSSRNPFGSGQEIEGFSDEEENQDPILCFDQCKRGGTLVRHCHNYQSHILHNLTGRKPPLIGRLLCKLILHGSRYTVRGGVKIFTRNCVHAIVVRAEACALLSTSKLGAENANDIPDYRKRLNEGADRLDKAGRQNPRHQPVTQSHDPCA